MKKPSKMMNFGLKHACFQSKAAAGTQVSTSVHSIYPSWTQMALGTG